MADIGAEVGIAASAIYWHYPGKQHLLVALFDDCLDRLLSEQSAAVADLGRTRSAVMTVTEQQVDFVLNEHSFAKVYYQEAHHLPPDEQVRLRRKQRDYVEAWTELLHGSRPDLAGEVASDLVHATIGAIQSALVHRSQLDEQARRRLLVETGERILLG